jgi:diguanylate cyclase (GGDEF)-like protein
LVVVRLVGLRLVFLRLVGDELAAVTRENATARPPAVQVAPVSKARYPGPPPLSRAAKTHLWLVVLVAVGLAVASLSQLGSGSLHWGRFLILAVLTTGAQLYTVDRPGKQSYKTSIVFLIAAAILLSPPLLVLVAAVQYLPEWARTRKKLTVMGFNIAKGVIDTLAAWGAYKLSAEHLPLGTGNDLRLAVAGLIACFAYVFVNHLLLARMVSLAHGLTLRDTKLFSFDYFTTDLFLAFLGVGVATLWLRSPFVIPLVVAPLVLTHRALTVPQLKAEARIDSKTGLSNARHFASVFGDELARAIRYERPLSLVMADLDLLRDINNTHGHLAGDAVLRGIAEIFGQQLRQYDLPSRFGGEEFCILLPETPPEHAVEIAERIRRAVESADFAVGTAKEPIRATTSIGVAAYPRDGATTDELVNAADLAVYRAKLQGRNRVVDAPVALASV